MIHELCLNDCTGSEDILRYQLYWPISIISFMIFLIYLRILVVDILTFLKMLKMLKIFDFFCCICFFYIGKVPNSAERCARRARPREAWYSASQ